MDDKTKDWRAGLKAPVDDATNETFNAMADQLALQQHKIDKLSDALRQRDAEVAKLRILAKRRPGSVLDLAVEIADLRREFYILRRHLMGE